MMWCRFTISYFCIVCACRAVADVGGAEQGPQVSRMACARMADLALRYLDLATKSACGGQGQQFLSLLLGAQGSAQDVVGSSIIQETARKACSVLLQVLARSPIEACVFWSSAAYFTAFGFLPETVSV